MKGMKRRDFAKVATASLVLAPTVFQTSFGAEASGKGTSVGGKETASAPEFVAGKQYAVLQTPAPVGASQGKVEVLEFFWYACPHCMEFEPILENWLPKIPNYYAFERVPINFGTGFDKFQRLYYTLLDMGVVNKMQLKVMKAVQVERVNMQTDNAIFAWIKTQGLDESKFKSIYQSFGIGARIARATQLQNAYALTGVPAMGIAGKYLSDPNMTNSLQKLLQVTDYLAAKSRTKVSKE